MVPPPTTESLATAMDEEAKYSDPTAVERGDDDIRALGVPDDDVGAETQARFRYQAEIAARHCLAMLTDESVAAVICEWFDDYVVLTSDGRATLVSVKHREGTQGPWRLRDLARTVLSPLLERWLKTGRKAQECRVATNGSLRPGPDETAGLKDACDQADASRLDRFARQLAPHMGVAETEVRSFLGVLAIEAELPGRRDIGLNSIEHLLRPALRSLSLTESKAEGAYESVVALVEAASRLTRDARVNTFRVINEPSTVRRALEVDSLLRGRTITPDQAQAAVRSALAQRPPVLAPGRVPAASSAMVMKLEAGGLGPTGVSSAQRLRAIWSETEARFRVGLPGSDDDLEDLRTRVQAMAAEAEAVARSGVSPGQPYGNQMHAELMRRIADEPASTWTGMRLDPLHLRGLVYQLTDECSVWWAASEARA
jgi:hypothetical protein